MPGCFAFDTVRIRVNSSAVINLGADERFCLGDSVTFDAGPGFDNYQWSTGETTQQIVAKQAGQYRVVATALTGCKSADTVAVIQVFAVPVLNLDKNPGLCLGEKRTLSAGNYTSYLWNTGSVMPSITVSTPGTYKVNVADINGCKGSDSVSITASYPLPAAFLPRDTFICSYGSLEINSTTNFNRYLWSTGSSTSSIVVTQPGLYWLDATDRHLCTGRDTIMVNLKDCLSGFFMPTAYTPNGDGRNDKLKPLLFGIVNKYEFTVYNRWGQIVFRSDDQTKGWDGKLGGVNQDGGPYIWSCTYQFKDQEMKTVKGTVILIR